MTQRATAPARLTRDDGRHLLRRLVFAATPTLDRLAQGRSADALLDALLSESRRAAMPMSPEVVRQRWTNTALRRPGMTDERYDMLRTSQVRSKQHDVESAPGLNALGEASRHLHRAVRGSGNSFDYPDTSFSQSLRWTGDMLETVCAARVYYVTIGSFDTPQSASFDTHIDRLAKQRGVRSARSVHRHRSEGDNSQSQPSIAAHDDEVLAASDLRFS